VLINNRFYIIENGSTTTNKHPLEDAEKIVCNHLGWPKFKKELFFIDSTLKGLRNCMIVWTSKQSEISLT